MNTVIMQTTRQPFNYFKMIFNILNMKRMVPTVTLKYATNIDALDAFTRDLILKHKENLYTKNNAVGTHLSLENPNLKHKDMTDVNGEELDNLIHHLLSKNKDKNIEQVAIDCLNTRRFINEATLKKLFRHYSLLGKPDMVTVLQKYCSKVDPNLYRRNAEFMHYLAKAQCLKGNSEKGLSILKYCYLNFENRRSMYRLLFRDLIQDSVLNRSEASLVIFRKYVKEFSDMWGDHYPLVCFWHICWSSSWFSDQVLAEELIESSECLRDIVKDKATAFSITVLKDYNEDAVVRLLQGLLKYAMIDEYAKVLQILFTYKCTNAAVKRVFSLGNEYWSSEKSQLSVKTLSAVLTVTFNMQNDSCSDVATLLYEHPHLAKKKSTPKKMRNRDIRGCTEIIRNCEVLGISLPSDQQGKYITMLITGQKVDDKPYKPTKPGLKNFKLKF